MSEKTSTLNAEEVQSIFKISEKIDHIVDEATKLYSIAMVYNAGLDFMHEQDLSLSQEVCKGVSDIFTDISYDIKETLSSIHDTLSSFLISKRNEVYCNE